MTWNVPGYTAERRLGQGATGEVWSGRDDDTGEPVALKRLLPGAGEPDQERLRREAALLAAFRHPHVVGLRGVLSSEVGIVLVLDLAAGGSLAQLMARRDRLRSGQTVALLAPVAGALAAAHAAGLVHGDVSPGNVLLDGAGQPLLADLGTARLAGDRATPAHGTSGYIDPAVRAGAAPTAASDVYSLAAVAARALTGQALAETEDAVPRWADHAYLLGVPSALVLTVCEALDAEPGRRPAAAAMASRLLAAAPAEPLGGLVGSPAGWTWWRWAVGRRGRARTWPWRRVHRRRAGFGGGMPAVLTASSDGVFAIPDRGDLGFPELALTTPGVFAGQGPDDVTRRVPRPPEDPAPITSRRWWSRLPLARSFVGMRCQRRACWHVGAGPALSSLPGTPPPARRAGLMLLRWATLVVAVVVLVGAAAFVWVTVAGPPDSSEPRAGAAEVAVLGVEYPLRGHWMPRSAAEAPGEWARVLVALDGQREAAFARADARLLAAVHAPGSAPLAADQQAVRSLNAAGARAVGVRHEIRQVRLLGRTPCGSGWSSPTGCPRTG